MISVGYFHQLDLLVVALFVKLPALEALTQVVLVQTTQAEQALVKMVPTVVALRVGEAVILRVEEAVILRVKEAVILRVEEAAILRVEEAVALMVGVATILRVMVMMVNPVNQLVGLLELVKILLALVILQEVGLFLVFVDFAKEELDLTYLVQKF